MEKLKSRSSFQAWASDIGIDVADIAKGAKSGKNKTKNRNSFLKLFELDSETASDDASLILEALIMARLIVWVPVESRGVDGWSSGMLSAARASLSLSPSAAPKLIGAYLASRFPFSSGSEDEEASGAAGSSSVVSSAKPRPVSDSGGRKRSRTETAEGTALGGQDLLASFFPGHNINQLRQSMGRFLSALGQDQHAPAMATVAPATGSAIPPILSSSAWVRPSDPSSMETAIISPSAATSTPAASLPTVSPASPPAKISKAVVPIEAGSCPYRSLLVKVQGASGDPAAASYSGARSLSELELKFGPPSQVEGDLAAVPMAMIRAQTLVWDSSDLYKKKYLEKREDKPDPKNFPGFAWQIDLSPTGFVSRLEDYGYKGLFLALSTRLVPSWESCECADVAISWEDARETLREKASSTFKHLQYESYRDMMLAGLEILSEAKKEYNKVMRNRASWSKKLEGNLSGVKTIRDVCAGLDRQFQEGPSLLSDVMSDFQERMTKANSIGIGGQCEFIRQLGQFLGGLLYKSSDNIKRRAPPTVSLSSFWPPPEDSKSTADAPKLRGHASSPTTRAASARAYAQSTGDRSAREDDANQRKGVPLSLEGAQALRLESRNPADAAKDTRNWEDRRTTGRRLFPEPSRQFANRDWQDHRRPFAPAAPRWQAPREADLPPPTTYSTHGGDSAPARDRWPGGSLPRPVTTGDKAVCIPVSSSILFEKGVDNSRHDLSLLCRQRCCAALGPHFPFECPVRFADVLGELPPGFRWVESRGDRNVAVDNFKVVLLDGITHLAQQTTREWDAFVRTHNLAAAPSYYPGRHSNYPPSFTDGSVAAAPPRAQ